MKSLLTKIFAVLCLAAVTCQATTTNTIAIPLSQLPALGTNPITALDFLPGDNYQGTQLVTVKIPTLQLKTNFNTGGQFSGTFTGTGSNFYTSFLGGVGDSFSARIGGTTNQWIDQVAVNETNLNGGIFYTNAAHSGDWVTIDVTNQLNSLFLAMSNVSGPKLVMGMGGINDLSNGGGHSSGAQNSNQVFLAITNEIAQIHAHGAKALWGIQPIMGGNAVSALTYGTNWLCLCQMLRTLTNGNSNYPTNVIPDYLVDFANYQGEMAWMPDGHPNVQAQLQMYSMVVQALYSLPSFNVPASSAVHFTAQKMCATNFYLPDAGSGAWVPVLGFNTLLYMNNGNAVSHLATGYNFFWNNGSVNLMQMDSSSGNLTLYGALYGPTAHITTGYFSSLWYGNTLFSTDGSGNPTTTYPTGKQVYWNNGSINLLQMDSTSGNATFTGSLTAPSVAVTTATAGSVTVNNTATAQTVVATNLCLAGQFGAITQFYVNANGSNSITVPAGKTYFVSWNSARNLNTLIWTNGYGVGSPVTITNLAWPVPGPLILKQGWVLSLYDTSGYPGGGVYYPL